MRTGGMYTAKDVRTIDVRTKDARAKEAPVKGT